MNWAAWGHGRALGDLHVRGNSGYHIHRHSEVVEHGAWRGLPTGRNGSGLVVPVTSRELVMAFTVELRQCLNYCPQLCSVGGGHATRSIQMDTASGKTSRCLPVTTSKQQPSWGHILAREIRGRTHDISAHKYSNTCDRARSRRRAGRSAGPEPMPPKVPSLGLRLR
eukprot:8539368-Pyramimonas_sp.AAC.1